MFPERDPAKLHTKPHHSPSEVFRCPQGSVLSLATKSWWLGLVSSSLCRYCFPFHIPHSAALCAWGSLSGLCTGSEFQASVRCISSQKMPSFCLPLANSSFLFLTSQPGRYCPWEVFADSPWHCIRYLPGPLSCPISSHITLCGHCFMTCLWPNLAVRL